MKMNPALYVAALLCVTIPMESTVRAVETGLGAVSLGWLGDSAAPVSTGVSWGVPWPKGSVQKDQAFTLTAADGKSLLLQTWPLAYWPDGSLKWSGFATVAAAKTVGTFRLAAGTNPMPSGPRVTVSERSDAVEIDTGGLQCRILRQGPNFVEALTMDGRVVARDGRLVCILQNSPMVDVDTNAPLEKFVSQIDQVTVEQSGPVRAVVRLEGRHKSESSGRAWLPFTVRLYFYAGSQPVRMVHTFVFDGDHQKDFIRGLGVVFAVPMREEVQNRHVRLSGEGKGLWAEPVEPLLGFNWHVNYPGGGDVYNDQIAGRRMPNKSELDANSQRTLAALTAWDDFRLIQPNAGGFTIEKRTGPKSAWISAGAGKRGTGLVFAGDTSGGLAVGLKNFWQSYPASLEVRHARSDAAELRVWFWSPDAPAMDLRHYDTVAHGLNATYEDPEPDLSTSTPFGVARTSELTLYPTAGLPSKDETAAQVQAAVAPPLLVCSPQYLHDVRAFGIWSLQDRSTPFKRAVEDQLDAMTGYYQKAVEQWNWYGFWDFGDIMHSYDAARHVWRYDVGGFAWDNEEQGTDMWLWYSFLRTGRADIFRMAEAMTRHCGEVDCYHLGPLAGLGSRHNVRHWGCGAKEARISMAPYKRFYYYLTTDERTGDVMREMLAADTGVTVIDPMRKVIPPTEADKQFPARVRGGPDWFALVGNWMTEWERTGDLKWRNKIYAGMDSIAQFPFLFRTSQSLLWGFYPDTGKLVPRDLNRGSYNLVTNMGGPEIIFELNEMIDHPGWMKAWLDYCENGGNGRMAAYAYRVTKDPVFGQRALGAFGAGGGRGGPQYGTPRRIEGPLSLNAIEEGPDGIITNGVNQNSLQMIEVLDMCADQLPAEMPPRPDNPPGGRGAARGRGAPPVPNPPAPVNP
jgi:hypothetical protein